MRPDLRRRLEGWLNGATALLLVAAAGLLVHDRLLPAWRARQVVEVGERVPEDLGLLTLAARDTLRLGRMRPSLILLFQSTCPACTRNLPAWRRLVEERPAGVRSLAVGLEAEDDALRYVREELPRALATRPLDTGRMTRILGVEAVPTTLIVAGDGRLTWRRTGVLGEADLQRALDRAREAHPSDRSAGAPVPRHSNRRRP